MIDITLNGRFLQIPNLLNIEKLAEMNGYKNPKVVIVDNEKLKLSQYKEYKIKGGDNIIIKRVLGGG